MTLVEDNDTPIAVEITTRTLIRSAVILLAFAKFIDDGLIDIEDSGFTYAEVRYYGTDLLDIGFDAIEGVTA